MGVGTALITGASSGIGAELARLCAAAGYDLILAARRTDRLTELGSQLAAAHRVQSRAVAADLSDAAAPDALFGAVRGTGIDILINNAGLATHGRYWETDWNRQAALLQVNMMAPAHLTRLFLPEMVRRGSGRVLQVASTAAFVPGPLMATYYASKAFLVSFSEAIANELKGTGVSMTVLCPGPTRTEFFEVNALEKTPLASGGAMSAEAVAREGYRAMMRGEAEVIAGARNRWLMRGARLAPRGMLADVTRRLNGG